MIYYGSFSSSAGDPLSGDRRVVFLLERGMALVVEFTSGVGYASVKVWDTTTTPLSNTIARWRTRNRYEASVGEVMSAYKFAKDTILCSADVIRSTDMSA